MYMFKKNTYHVYDVAFYKGIEIVKYFLAWKGLHHYL